MAYYLVDKELGKTIRYYEKLQKEHGILTEELFQNIIKYSSHSEDDKDLIIKSLKEGYKVSDEVLLEDYNSLIENGNDMWAYQIKRTLDTMGIKVDGINTN